MPAWTLATLMSEVTAPLANRDEISGSRASFFVNEAYRMVAEELHQHNKMEFTAIASTTSGDQVVNLPSDFYELISLSNLSAVPPYQLRQINSSFADSYTTVSGEPQFYNSYATFLELYPSPNSAYSLQLRYRGELSDMTLTTAVPSLATRYHYAIYLKARELAADSQGDFERAGVARNQYFQYMRTAPSDQGLRVRQNHELALSLAPRAGSRRPLPFDRSDS